jgi:endonuclease/exonuclease/phosphatase family metal-dependent hydrolase
MSTATAILWTMVRRPAVVVVALLVAVATLMGVAAAGEQISSSGTAVPAQPRTVKIMTWNLCGGNNPGCPHYLDPAALVTAVGSYMSVQSAPLDATLLQEVCQSIVPALERELEQRDGARVDVLFAPIKIKRGTDPALARVKQCDLGRGAYGIAVVVPEGNPTGEVRYLPSPEGAEWRVALCVTVAAWHLRLCNTHLSNGTEDPRATFRAAQVQAYLAHAGLRSHVVLGGDLNLQPNSPHLEPAYTALVECAQADQAAPRAGPGTFYPRSPHDDTRTVKIDYLFTNPGTAHTCDMPPGVVQASDHRPLWITVELPADRSNPTAGS